jgi:hypothetical protein
MNASETADNMKHLSSILEFTTINELERTLHFKERTSILSTPSTGSRFSEYDPATNKYGWQIQSMEEVDETGKPLGKKPIQLDRFSRETGISEKTVKTAVSLALSELVNQTWIDEIQPADERGYHSLKLGKFAFSVGSSLYSPVYFIHSSSKAGDTAWLTIREKHKITTVKFFPWNVDSETLAQDALFSVNVDRNKNNKKQAETARLLMIPGYDATPITYEYFKSNFSVMNPGNNKTFFRIGLSSADDETSLVNSVKRAFGSDVKIQSELTRMGRVEKVERERADSGKYFNLDDATQKVFMYLNQDPNNKNMEPGKFNTLEVLKAIKPGSSRTREVEVRNQKTGRTFILKLNPGDVLKIARKKKEGGYSYNKVEVTPTDNTPQNAKRISVRYADA